MSNKAVLFGMPIWVLFCILLVVWGGVTAFMWWLFSDPSQSGTFGDTFGAVNSLFSGLAFLGILYTVTQQKNQFQKQTFEDNFFRMLELHNSLVSELDVTFEGEGGPEITRHGREVLLSYYTILKNKFSTIHVVKMEIANLEGILCDINKVYLPFFDEAKPRLGQYFRFLYNVVKFTAENAPSNKQDYMNIIRAQLAPHEQTLLFYNGLSKFGSERFKPLIEKYGLLEGLPIRDLAIPNHKDLYSASAYGDGADTTNVISPH